MLTTVLGFLALCYSESPPYRSLGVITALGVFTGWLYLMLFVPLVLSRIAIDYRPKHGLYRWTQRLSHLVVSHYRTLGISFAVIVLGLALCIPRIELNDNPRLYIDESVDFRIASDFISEHFSGSYALSFKVPAREAGGISEPEYMQALDKFSKWLRSWPEVRNVDSAAEITKRLNKAFNGDDPAFYTVPATRPLISQYLLLYEMSLPYGHSLDNMFDMDKSATRLDVSFGSVDFQTLRSNKQRIERWMQDNLPSYMASPGSGPSALFASITRRNILSMVESISPTLQVGFGGIGLEPIEQ